MLIQEKTMSDLLATEIVDNGIAIPRLGRDPVNALNPDFLHAIHDEFERLEANSDVRAVVLTSATKVLSAGLDLKEILKFTDIEERATVDGLNKTYGKLYGFSKPVITAANGHAIAGGLFFVLIGDYRLTVEKALFGLTEVRVGVDFPIGPMEIARHELSPHVARIILQRGQNVSAKKALEFGIVDEITAPDALLDRALELAEEYAAIPPKAYRSVKAQLRGPVLDKINSANAAQSDPALKGWFTDETHIAARKILGG
jgi:enoyl-CoA hydratase